jgi:hypothetical protein
MGIKQSLYKSDKINTNYSVYCSKHCLKLIDAIYWDKVITSVMVGIII